VHPLHKYAWPKERKEREREGDGRKEGHDGRTDKTRQARDMRDRASNCVCQLSRVRVHMRTMAHFSLMHSVAWLLLLISVLFFIL